MTAAQRRVLEELAEGAIISTYPTDWVSGGRALLRGRRWGFVRTFYSDVCELRNAGYLLQLVGTAGSQEYTISEAGANALAERQGEGEG